MMRSTLFALAGLSFVLTACGGSAADSSAVAYREPSANLSATRAFTCDLTATQKQSLIAALDGRPDDSPYDTTGAAWAHAAGASVPSLALAGSQDNTDTTTAEQPCSEQQYQTVRNTVVPAPWDRSPVSTEFQINCSLRIVRGPMDSQNWNLRGPDNPIRTQAELREWLDTIERMGARCLPEA